MGFGKQFYVFYEFTVINKMSVSKILRNIA